MADIKKIPVDIQIVVGLVLLTAVFILIPQLSDSAIRTVLGLPMVLFLPGYALIAALFPKNDDLDGIERVALSFGLSIAVVPLIGLGLNYTPWGIRLLPILISLSIFTIGMCIIAVVRRSNLVEEEAFYVPLRQSYESLQDEFHSESQSRLDKALTLILVISILASVVTLIYVVVTPKQGEQFTEFYILGPGGMADDYPVNYTLGDSGKVIIGVVNHEYEDVNYTIDIQLENQSLQTIQEVNLEHNQTWEQPVTITPPFQGTDMKLQFLLYKDGNYTESYRDLHLWINVSEDANE
ncbi:putative membrane protein [Methanohalophilus euhalobius]|uniref:Putative membrane protein n=1 Tax=Methanohalophilus euhalobius TaxID=51203 RepID=A0A285GGR5_9EURY|nr:MULTISPECIES: DUF1616 domain-containing protein [Methanohalophilus]ODV48884.1 MAG: hypothetical protein A8273_1805 [Methanohalophilus sp. 2-GBenrich]RSD33549.1 MAG: hypothetical protein CI952_1526 [Methanohalophilus sp.]TCL11560.1 putative membrane protein [Methanohalophilus euhalobius]SNY22384.1 Uncharacterized membrane protein [Methanohalophilus euhalobius]